MLKSLPKRTKALLVPLLVAVVASCAPVNYTNSSLKPYVADYVSLIKETCPTLKYNQPNQFYVGFTEFKDTVIGKCYRNPFRAIVLIDKKYWREASKNERLALIYHELSHCLLMLDHVNDPNNYMYPYADVNLSSQEVIVQVVKDIQGKCNAK